MKFDVNLLCVCYSGWDDFDSVSSRWCDHYDGVTKAPNSKVDRVHQRLR